MIATGIHVIETGILNRVLDRDWTLNRRGPLSGRLVNRPLFRDDEVGRLLIKKPFLLVKSATIRHKSMTDPKNTSEVVLNYHYLSPLFA